jgi:CRP/FNR family transcriptional regulator
LRSSIRDIKARCSICSARALCLSVGVDTDAPRRIDGLAADRVQLKRGDSLYRTGDPFNALHAIGIGSCKTTVLGEKGHEQVTGYHMVGDIVGMDGIGADRHRSEAVALEYTELCVLPFDRLEQLARDVPALQRNLHNVLSNEIAREENAMLLLGSMRAEERVALFLLNLSKRYRERGYSGSAFLLRLTRADIGSYLGLKLETVSRLLSRFDDQGLLRVRGRAIELLDIPALEQLIKRRF